MKALKIIRIISVALILLGLIGIAPTLWYRYTLSRANAVPQAPAVVAPVALKPETVSGKPFRLLVPDAGVDIAVADGTYNQNTKQWSLSLDKAHFATITSPANNETGNTYIYGHNRKGIFLNLGKLQNGAFAQVDTNNGYRFTYKLSKVQTVNPADTSVFAYQGPPILTLQTCSGAWYQNRQQFTFELESYEKII